MELLAKAKLNSIEEKFMKAIKAGKITDEEFNDIEQDIKNYEDIQLNILNDYNEKGKNLNDDLELQLLDKGKTIGRNEEWDSINLKLKK